MRVRVFACATERIPRAVGVVDDCKGVGRVGRVGKEKDTEIDMKYTAATGYTSNLRTHLLYSLTSPPSTIHSPPSRSYIHLPLPGLTHLPPLPHAPTSPPSHTQSPAECGVGGKESDPEIDMRFTADTGSAKPLRPSRASGGELTFTPQSTLPSRE